LAKSSGAARFGPPSARLEEEDFPDHPEDVGPALGRRDVEFDLIREEDQAHLVVVANGGERQHAAEFGHALAFALRGGPEIPRGTDIHQQQDGQLPLLDKFLHEGLPGSGGDLPVNGSHFIPRHVLAHLVEVHAAAFEDRVVLAGQGVIHQSVGLDLDLANLAQDFPYKLRVHGVYSFLEAGCSAGSGHGNRVQDLLHHVLAGQGLRLGLVSHLHAMAQDVHGDGLDVLGRHVTAAVQVGQCAGRRLQAEGGPG
jgi:hypothetical protein